MLAESKCQRSMVLSPVEEATLGRAVSGRAEALHWMVATSTCFA